MKLAKARHRVMATLLDFCIVFSFVLIITLGKLPFFISMIRVEDQVLTLKFIIDMIRWGVLFSVALFTYYGIIPLLMNGQTIGKKVFKLKIVRDNNQQVDYKTIFFREGIGRIFINFASLGITIIASTVIMLLRDDKKDLADIIAKTKVIDLYESEE